MKAVATKEVIVTLVLTKAEARMLMDMMQNPMCDEPVDEADFRHRLFDTLKDAVTSQ